MKIEQARAIIERAYRGPVERLTAEEWERLEEIDRRIDRVPGNPVLDDDEAAFLQSIEVSK